MPLQATSGAASYDAFGGGVAAVPTYIEDVFSVQVYGTSASPKTITNGIDLSGKGGLVWTKARNIAEGHRLVDTVRGATKVLLSNETGAQATESLGLTSFLSDGYVVNVDSGYNGAVGNSYTYASWTFRKQPKFFDVVTWTGNGALPNQLISHNLGSVPGCIIIKATNSVYNWIVWHRGNGTTNYGGLSLNLTAASAGSISSGDLPTATQFKPGAFFDLDYNNANATGVTYVAYLFAHNAGGFGLTGTDNVISCGSYTGNGTTSNPISLGYEPQFIIVKSASGVGNWFIWDVMRGWDMQHPTTGVGDRGLLANSANAEADYDGGNPTATGFNAQTNVNDNGVTYIYIAIRRGPMKVPTSGTSVFSPTAYTATNVNNRLVNTGIVTDMTMARNRIGLRGFYTADRLRGDGFLQTAATDAEATDADSFMTPTSGVGNSFSAMNGFGVGADITRRLNYSTLEEIAYAFRRAPSFFDEVCWTGDGTQNRAIAHNLNAAPELIITKTRNSGDFSWFTYTAPTGLGGSLFFNNTSELNTGAGAAAWGSTTFNSSNFYISGSSAGYSGTNGSGTTYLGYLFATCAGVSKVGSYTGTGTTLQVNCGFTGGARFVLIKRTDSTGDWYVWDSARGIVSGNDPYLLLNSTAAEVTNTDYIDTYSAGFEISSTAPAAINASGGTFIFLAIA